MGLTNASAMFQALINDDHNHVTCLQSTSCRISHQARWTLDLGCFNFSLSCHPGCRNVKHDAFSCMHDASPEAWSQDNPSLFMLCSEVPMSANRFWLYPKGFLSQIPSTLKYCNRGKCPSWLAILRWLKHNSLHQRFWWPGGHRLSGSLPPPVSSSPKETPPIILPWASWNLSWYRAVTGLTCQLI